MSRLSIFKKPFIWSGALSKPKTTAGLLLNPKVLIIVMLMPRDLQFFKMYKSFLPYFLPVNTPHPL